jgi:hypothetical protein
MKMPGKQEIELFINDNGELSVHIKGIKGASCVKVLDALVKDMGTARDKHLTSEYYEAEARKIQEKTKIK